MIKTLLILPGFLFLAHAAMAQDNAVTTRDLEQASQKYLTQISSRSSSLDQQLTDQTKKYLHKLERQEARMREKLGKTDSLAATKIFSRSAQRYADLEQEISDKSQKTLARSNTILTKGRQYIPLLDTLKTSLKFLGQYGDAIKNIGSSSAQIGSTMAKLNGMEDELQQAEEVQQFIRERRQMLTDQLQRYNMGGEIQQFNKEAYYYAQQLQEYKAALNDPEKIEEKVIGLLNQLPAFQQFMKQNSMLASLFPAPAGLGTPQSLAGLQTRGQVQQLIQDRIAAGGAVQAGGPGSPAAQIGQNVADAQSEINSLKEKANQFGSGGSNMDLPDFKPNLQKTKTFLQRLEYGTNIQTQRSNFLYPITTDLALSVGYKLNEKNVIGLAASYKMGWGKDLQHMAISSEGMGFRSFADMHLKGSFFVSGGFEYNYQQAFYSLQQVVHLDNWRQSGLLGISKIISIKTRLFSKTKLQLLWDFLSYQQMPKAEPIVFRIGYSF